MGRGELFSVFISGSVANVITVKLETEESNFLLVEGLSKILSVISNHMIEKYSRKCVSS